MNKFRRILSFIALIGFLSMTSCNTSKPVNYLDETPELYKERMQWWTDASFGMFIHWGAYAVPAGIHNGQEYGGISEWIMYNANISPEDYEQYPAVFNPVKYNAEQWVKIAKNAGMKYIVITSKHHDGFCLWDSEVSEYDIVDFSPYKKDLLKPLAEACEKEGIKLCFYHSIMDWHHPDANKENWDKYREEYLKPQLEELITEYGDIGVLWFDGEWIPEWTEEQGKDLYNFLRNLKPDIIINNRVGKGREGMQGMNKDNSYAGDFGTPEQEILGTKSNLAWESCMTMNTSWGFKLNDNNWKSSEVLIHNLIDIASKGGNYLLNVGPTAEGLIPEASVERLADMGSWLELNGESIYESQSLNNYKEGDEIRYTKSADGKNIYVHLLHWPGDRLNIKYLKIKQGTEIKMLGYETSLKWSYDPESGTFIDLPGFLQLERNRPCNFAWVLKVEANEVEVTKPVEFSTEGRKDIQQYLFGEELSVEMNSYTSDVDIYYTLNDKDPDKNSKLYTNPLIISKSETIKAIAIKKGMVSSPLTEAKFIKTTKFKRLDVLSEISPNYSGLGELTLADNERGTENFSDKKWLGFEGNDFEAVIDMGEIRKINNIRLGVLQMPGSWIFYPEKTEFFISDDGKDYQIAFEETDNLLKEDKVELHDIICNLNKKTRFIKIKAKNIGICPTWHAGSGAKAWLFIDEIIVE